MVSPKKEIGIVCSPSTSGSFVCELTDEGRKHAIGVTALVKVHHPDLNRYIFGIVEEVKEIMPEMSISPSRVGEYAQMIAGGSHEVNEIVTKIAKSRRVSSFDVRVLGYLENGELKRSTLPVPVGSKVLLPTPEEIAEILSSRGEIKIGKLSWADDIELELSINEVIPTHVAIFAQTNHGKTYTASCIVEDLLERKAPVIVLEPTKMEWHTLSLAERRKGYPVSLYRLEKDFLAEREVKEAKNRGANLEEHILYLNIMEDKLESLEAALEMVSGEVSDAGRRILDSVISSLERVTKYGQRYTLGDIITEVRNIAQSAKTPYYTRSAAEKLLSQLTMLKKLGVFPENNSNQLITARDIAKKGRLSVINLRGASSNREVCATAYLVLKRLILARKAKQIPPIVIVLEEAHEFCPRNRETKLSNLIGNLARQGRGLGIGLIIVSQKPSKINETVVSQCGTVIIGRLTGDSDLSYIRTVLEGIDQSIIEELKRLKINEKLLRTPSIGKTINKPILVEVRQRRTLHGGETPDFLAEWEGRSNV